MNHIFFCFFNIPTRWTPFIHLTKKRIKTFSVKRFCLILWIGHSFIFANQFLNAQTVFSCRKIICAIFRKSISIIITTFWALTIKLQVKHHAGVKRFLQYKRQCTKITSCCGVSDCPVFNGLWLINFRSYERAQAFGKRRFHRHQHNVWCTCKDDADISTVENILRGHLCGNLFRSRKKSRNRKN